MKPSIQLKVFDDAQAVAEAAADYIADQARDAVATRGRFLLAMSGGHTPWVMLAALAAMPLPWSAVEVFQVDERVAPAEDADRNLLHLREALQQRAPLRPEQVHAMRVESLDLAGASRDYAAELETHAGTPPVLDLVHLGLGPDGHTASLVPGDPSLQVVDADVTLSGPYQGRRRMTLTYPVIDRARRVLWVVTGAEKAAMLRRLLDGDRAIPAGRVRRDRAIAFVDRDAAGYGERVQLPGRNGAMPALGNA